MRSLLLAAAAILLLALPARLLAGSLARTRSENGPRRRGRFFGRNRSASELRAAETRLADATGTPAAAQDASAVTGPTASTAGVAARPSSSGNRRLLPAVFAAAAALVTLSSPVQDLGAYLRVLLAIVLALAAVNGCWVAVARWSATRLGAGRIEVVFRPTLLLIVAAAAIGSRMLGLQPALLFGLVLSVVVADGASRTTRARIAAVQVTGLATVGVLAWLAVGILPTPSNSLSAFATELANSLALLGLGSAAIMLLPVGPLAGRAVFQRSRLGWLALSLVIDTLLFALLLPVASLVGSGQNTVVLVVAAIGFAALSVSVWLWERYVEPSRS
ncbi:hypothetical protein [Leifsonia poae]|uniref:hypothetical protein n=1 Tax=Leifsonia poae TaxID=110933 RepID=UPI001CBB2335|nr:hypothetical protein [Leifsonia poae]